MIARWLSKTTLYSNDKEEDRGNQVMRTPSAANQTTVSKKFTRKTLRTSRPYSMVLLSD